MKQWIRKKIAILTKKHVVPHLPQQSNSQTLISKVARFVACEMIEGDYLEFGVYQGASFISAYHAISNQFDRRIRQETGGINLEEARQQRKQIWASMRFFAFDSFQGLPSLTEEDLKSHDFQQGMYAFPQDRFRATLEKAGVAKEKLKIVPGWFSDSCTEETRLNHQLQKAAVVWIDCDLYSSTKSVLEFITPLLQDGTVIIFDDWYSYRGNPACGEQRAFSEWLATISHLYTAQEYQKEAWKRCSFIMSRKV